eukprot:TRINITY_DN5334_c0_g1_i3.p1 TRINITY_DN5334_c0_g1~~TRINITY_DN5334_c0_g1_i3.p1  ORF type:complete len:437 (-),score=122.95 TRINITY_DN5334_c0_g1_i3:673-1983(-)
MCIRDSMGTTSMFKRWISSKEKSLKKARGKSQELTKSQNEEGNTNDEGEEQLNSNENKENMEINTDNCAISYFKGIIDAQEKKICDQQLLINKLVGEKVEFETKFTESEKELKELQKKYQELEIQFDKAQSQLKEFAERAVGNTDAYKEMIDHQVDELIKAKMDIDSLSNELKKYRKNIKDSPKGKKVKEKEKKGKEKPVLTLQRLNEISETIEGSKSVSATGGRTFWGEDSKQTSSEPNTPERLVKPFLMHTEEEKPAEEDIHSLLQKLNDLERKLHETKNSDEERRIRKDQVNLVLNATPKGQKLNFDSKAAPTKSYSFTEVSENAQMWQDAISQAKRQKFVRRTDETWRKLIDGFIPPSLRTVIWPLLIGNPLNITKEYYRILLAAYKKEGVPVSIRRVIKEDINRTFPYTNFLLRKGISLDEFQTMLELFHV